MMDANHLANLILKIAVILLPAIATIITFTKARKTKIDNSNADDFFHHAVIPIFSAFGYFGLSVVFIGWGGAALLTIMGFNIK